MAMTMTMTMTIMITMTTTMTMSDGDDYDDADDDNYDDGDHDDAGRWRLLRRVRLTNCKAKRSLALLYMRPHCRFIDRTMKQCIDAAALGTCDLTADSSIVPWKQGLDATAHDTCATRRNHCVQNHVCFRMLNDA